MIIIIIKIIMNIIIIMRKITTILPKSTTRSIHYYSLEEKILRNGETSLPVDSQSWLFL